MSMTCCDFQISENHRCGSYAFNLWQEGVTQEYCDKHHWQDEATRLRAELQSMTDDRDSWEKQASDRTDDALQFANERDAARAEVEALRSPVARPLAEWHEDMGPVLWWKFPIMEPPYCGRPDDCEWSKYFTHWTPIVVPSNAGQGGK